MMLVAEEPAQSPIPFSALASSNYNLAFKIYYGIRYFVLCADGYLVPGQISKSNYNDTLKRSHIK